MTTSDNLLAGMCFEVMGTMLGVIIYTICYLAFVEKEEDVCMGGARLSDPNKVRMLEERDHCLACLPPPPLLLLLLLPSSSSPSPPPPPLLLLLPSSSSPPPPPLLLLPSSSSPPTSPLLPSFSSSSFSSSSSSSSLQIRAYRYQGVIIAVFTLVFVWITAFGVREQQEEIEQNKNVGFVTGIRTTLGYWPYLCLMLFELFVWLAVQVPSFALC